MKGQEWYQDEPIAEAYESKRFSGGGKLIDQRERQAVLDALQPVASKRILEIACGTGRFSIMLAEHGADVTGIDISTAMLSRSRAKSNATAVDTIDFIRGDAARLPFPDNSFDAVFAVRFFHLTDTPSRYLREMRRVTKDRVFFDTFNARSARTVYNWLLPMGSHLYTEKTISHLLNRAQLELISVETDFVAPYGIYRSLPDLLANPLRSVDERFGQTSLGQRLATVTYWTTRTTTTHD